MQTTNTASDPLVIQFDAKALAPVALFMAKNDIRYYLQGISVMTHPSGGCLVVATNGHQMAVWYDKDGQCSADTIFRISPALIAASKKKASLIAASKKKASQRLIPRDRKITFTDGRIVLAEHNGDGSVFEELFVQAGKPIINGDFPKVARVMPDPADLQPGSLCAYNATLMIDVLKAGKILSGTQYLSGIYHYTNKKPDAEGDWGLIVTRFEGVDNFVTYTMPCRVTRDKTSIPASFEAFRLGRLKK